MSQQPSKGVKAQPKLCWAFPQRLFLAPLLSIPKQLQAWGCFRSQLAGSSGGVHHPHGGVHSAKNSTLQHRLKDPAADPSPMPFGWSLGAPGKTEAFPRSLLDVSPEAIAAVGGGTMQLQLDRDTAHTSRFLVTPACVFTPPQRKHQLNNQPCW